MTDAFIGIVCGLQSEASAIRAAIRAAGLAEGAFRIGVSGASAPRADEIARSFAQEGARALLSVGISGGLDPALQPGDLVIGNCVSTDDGGDLQADERLAAAFAALAPKATRDETGAAPQRFRCGRLFGADAIIATAHEKARLYADTNALAVDMESHGVARAAATAGVPFLAVRAIADPARRALPPAALDAVAPDGSTRALKTIGAALRDPRQFSALMKLGADSNAALKTLRKELPQFLRSLRERLISE